MSLMIQDYTLSHVHFNVAQVAFAEQYEAAMAPFFWPPIDKSSQLLSGAQIYFDRSTGFVTSDLTTTFANSAREALDLNFEIEKAELIRQVQYNLFDTDVPSDVDAISITVDHTYELISRWGPSSIDLNRSVGADNVLHLAAILRVTSDLKVQVPGWDAALAYTIELMEQNGIDINDALFGLIAEVG